MGGRCLLLNSEAAPAVHYSSGHMDAHAPASFSADLSGCAALPMLAGDEVAELFMHALGRAGATIVRSVSHAFPETGLTCVLILAESRCSWASATRSARTRVAQDDCATAWCAHQRWTSAPPPEV